MLVDTNVLIDVLENDPEWANWSIAQLQAQSMIHKLLINPIIYSELSLTFSSIEELDATLEAMELPMLEMPKTALFWPARHFCNIGKGAAPKIMSWVTSLSARMLL